MKKYFKKPLHKFIGIIMAAVLVTGTAFAASQVGNVLKSKTYDCLYDKLLAEKGFIYGVNEPWVGSGHTTNCAIGGKTIDELLGNGRTHESPVDEYRRAFTNIKAIGYDAVKIWLFSGLNGIRVTEYGDILGYDDYFWDDFTAVMDIAQELGLAVDLTILPHQESYLSTQYTYASDGQMLYNALTQFVVNPDYRQNYLDKIIKPLCRKLNSDYRDTILSITVYCEPEGDTYGDTNGTDISGNYTYGTSWEQLCDFMNDAVACVKEYLPKVPTTVTSGWNPYKTYNYNDVDVDVVGVDVYNNSGNVPNPVDSMVNKPMWLTEFGPDNSDGYNHSDTFQMAYAVNFYDNAIEAGYTGAFQWMFSGTAPETITRDPQSYSQLRPVASIMHYRFIDEANERNGIDGDTVADKPALLYGDDALTLQWIASRNAESYSVELSYDGGKNFTKFADYTDVSAITNSSNICGVDISTVTQGRDITFRVTVTTEDGLIAVSDPLTMFIPKFTCSDEKNLIVNGGFETGDFTGWIADAGMTVVKGEEVGDTHRGDYCFKLPGDRANYQWKGISQIVQLEANTTYRITYYSKHTDDKYNKLFKVYSDTTSYINDLIGRGGEYTMNTYTFTTGDTAEEVTVRFANDYEPIYIDSVYLFKVDE